MTRPDSFPQWQFTIYSFVHMTFWALGMWLWLITIFFIPIRTHYFKDNSDQGNSMSSHSLYINLTNERRTRIFVIEMNFFPPHLKIRKLSEIYHYLHSWIYYIRARNFNRFGKLIWQPFQRIIWLCNSLSLVSFTLGKKPYLVKALLFF